MFTWKFWELALERMVRAGFAAFAAVVAAPQLGNLAAGTGVKLDAINWDLATGAGVVASIISLSISLAAKKTGDPQDPSFLK